MIVPADLAVGRSSRRGPAPLAAILALAALALAGATGAGGSAGDLRSALSEQISEQISVTGSVTDAAGTPLAGVTVELLPVARNHEVMLGLLARRPRPEALGVTSTDAAGRFRLTAPTPGVYRVTVTAGGFFPFRYFLLPVADPVELPPVAVPRTASSSAARFTVVDATGAPVTGAAVYVESASPALWSRWATAGWEPGARLGWTGDDGTIAFPRLRGERLTVTVHPPGRATPGRWEEVEGGVLTCTPTPAGRRTLEVRGPGGRPGSGVVVAVGRLAWPVGQTGDDGRLLLSGLAAEPTPVHLIAADSRRRVVVLEPEDDDGPRVVTLPAPRLLAGRVVEAGSGRPLAGALVWPAHDPGAFTITSEDVNGEDDGYRLAAPPGSRLHLQAHTEGYLPRAVTLEGEEVNDPLPVVELEPAVALRGTVVDGSGDPLPGARVTAADRSPERRHHAYRTDPAVSRVVAGADGRFTLPGLHPAGGYRVTAEAPGRTAAVVDVDRPGADPEPLRLVLESGRRASGRVLDLDERPVADAEVTIVAAGERSPLPDDDGSVVARTDREGRFVVHELPAERLDLVARGAGFAPTTVRGVQLPPGTAPVDLGTLLLAPGAAVRGVVVDPEGAPVAGAEVWATGDPGRIRVLAALGADRPDPAATAGDDGAFAVEDLEPGRPVELLVDADGHLPAAVPGVAVPPDEPVRVVLRPASRVSGRVVDVDGAPVAGAEVWLESRPAEGGAEVPGTASGEVPGTASGAASGEVSGTFDTLTGDDGAFLLAEVAPGPAEISAFAPGLQPSEEVAVEVPAGVALTGVELVLRPGATLEGWVNDRAGDPVPGAEVRAGRAAGTTGDDGGYRVEGIPPGVRRVEVDHPGYNRAEEEVEIDPGVNRADFVLDGGGPVAGRVVDEDEQPVAGAAVKMRHQDPRQGREYRATTGAGGAFEWPRVAEGGYLLEAEKAGYVPARRDDVTAGGEPVADVELVLRRGATVTGRVLGLGHEELAAVRVEAVAEGHRERPGEVDYDGRYRVGDLAPGDWTVRARLPGGGRQAEARVAIDPGVAEVARDLEFGRGVTLTGRVLQGGEPVAGAALTLTGHDVAGEREVVTGTAGDFRVADLRPGRYRLGVSDPRRSIVHNQDVELHADRDLLVELASGRVAGHVVSAETGEPVADALVTMRQLHAGAAPGSLFTAGTDAAGRFVHPRLPAGRFQLTARADGYRPAERELELPPGAQIEGLEVAVDPAAGLDLAVWIATATGAPEVPELVHLRIEGADGRARVAETRVPDPEGRVRFPSIPPGRWQLLVGAPGAAPETIPASVPSPEPVAAVLRAAGPLRVRVPALLEEDAVATLTLTDPAGAPFVHLEVGAEPQVVWRVVGGQATVPDVPAGAWTVTVTAPDGRAWVASAVTTGGPAVEVTVE